MKTFIIGIFLFISSCYCIHTNDYDTYKLRNCEVVEKISGLSTGKYSKLEFILILKTENQMFDIKVSPTTYSQSKVGDILVFNLRQFDIKQDYNENWYMFITTFSLIASIFLIFVGICFIVYDYRFRSTQCNSVN